MNSIKTTLKAMLSQGICISVNMQPVDTPQAVDHLIVHDDACYMFDYLWDENGNFRQLNVSILECTPPKKDI